ncbi:MAG: DUF456 domain-containing protein [Verrucomicrobiota bacterium]|nr:DUF456 domain-containing protein [Verrucomicrobiota bacterium]
MDAIIWFIFWVMILAGILGVVLPALPGFALIMAALVLHKIFMPDYFSGWLISAAVFVFILILVIDYLSVMGAAKITGSGRWGVGGAGVGMTVGFFYGFMGVIIGSFIGAFAGEKIFAKKEWWHSLKSGVGAAAGFLLAVICKMFLTLGIVFWIVVECLRNSL